jgi:hypothetical protein
MRTTGRVTGLTARVTGRVTGLATAGLLAAGLLAGCGSDTSKTVAQDPGAANSAASPSSAASSAPSSPRTPRCAQVWQNGARLPQPYRGCATAAGWVKAQVYQCEDGHRLVTYAHAFYASPGRTISRAATTLAKDQGFRHTMAACGA